MTMFSDMLSEAQKAAIADVTIASSELEAELERCIIELCKLTWSHGSILLENMRIDSKLNVFRQLLVAEFNDKDVPEGFTYANNNLKDLNAQRNVIVHGQWTLKSFAVARNGDLKPGHAKRDIESKDIVAHRTRNGKRPSLVAARQIKKVAELTSLNRQLLRRLFWEHFPERILGLSGVPTPKDRSSKQLRELIVKRASI
ncbi:MAG: hypothetical protein WBX11_18730 [Thiobacillaceae bacterium]